MGLAPWANLRQRPSIQPSTEPQYMTAQPETGASAAPAGLSAAQVQQARAAGDVNIDTTQSSRSLGQIVRSNLVTRFNILLGSLFIAILVSGEAGDALFGGILLCNLVIGIGQELVAKRTLDRLAVLDASTSRVRRDNATVEVKPTEIVLGDFVELRSGDQVPVDGEVVVSNGLEIDESLLTGEAEPEVRTVGHQLRSGSVVVAGEGWMVATHVGGDSFAAKLAAEARRFALTRSELRESVNRILRIVTFALVPVSALLVFTQVRNSEDGLRLALGGAVAGVVAMVPEGLVLLTSTAFALGIIRLGRRKVLTRELPAIEGLARVDVVCIDKTGTLTEGRSELSRVDVLVTAAPVNHALGALARADDRPNASALAISDKHADPGWKPEGRIAFSSERKWSAARFAEHGSWFMGAADVLLANLPDAHETLGKATAMSGEGGRVLVLCRSDVAQLTEDVPSALEPVALVLLSETVRSDAPETMRYLNDQGVRVVVISGDHPDTVAAVAKRAGVPEVGEGIDARDLGDDDTLIESAVLEHNVFGRVTPHQKRAMVQALQRNGHIVAMTGDGVNDALALKEADVGLAMGSGSVATRAVAQLVLLDNKFSTFPTIVYEGRRVIANVQRASTLFVTKSVYAFVLAVVVGVAGVPFPFLPRHLTLVSSLTIGLPAFLLALGDQAPRLQPDYLKRLLLLTIPGGIATAAATSTTYVYARAVDDISREEATTGAAIALASCGLWILLRVARPLSKTRAAIVALSAVLVVAAFVVPIAKDFFELSYPPSGVWAVALLSVLAAGTVMEVSDRLVRRHLCVVV